MRLVLGLDGGHTRTRAIILDASGNVLAWATAGPVAPIYSEADLERALGEVRAVVTACLSQVEGTRELTAACCGMTTGGEEAPFTAPLKETLHALVRCPTVVVRNDFETNLVGATGGREEGIVVVAGGGSMAYGAWAGRTARAGGWGSLFGDEGSGLAIGRAALNAASRALDGRGEPTLLADAIPRRFGAADLRGVARRIFAGSLTLADVADLTPTVADCAAAGDRAATEILRWAGGELALAALSVVRQLAVDEEVEVYPTGGVFRETRVLAPEFRRVLLEGAPKARVERPRHEPIAGCAICALQSAGVAATPELLARLDETLHRTGASLTREKRTHA